jgi:uncharacterized membrane protein YphA (DoxX/SURF4 family)
LGTVLFIVLVVVLLLLLLGAGTYSVRRRYYSPVGSEVVESDAGSGAGGGIAAALIALALLVILFLGFTQWNWFGTRSSTSPGGTQTISSPMPTANTGGGGTAASPAASPSAMPSTSP